MAAVTTERLMAIALEMAGWDETATQADSAIYYPGTRISHILLGVEIGTAELFMARQLGYHAVIAHRPAGYTGPLWEVYRQRHIALMVEAGVPREEAEVAVGERMNHLRLASLAENYDRVPSVARLLEMPFLSILSPLEEVGRRLLAQTIEETRAANPAASVADLRDALLLLPEYAAAPVAPSLALGAWDAPAAQVAVVHATYEPPNAAIARTYLTHGVTTLICASFAAGDAEQLRREGIAGSILALGSIATASLGLNPYIQRLRADGLEVAPFSGVIGSV